MLVRLDHDHEEGLCVGFQLTMQGDGKAWTAHYRHPDLNYTTATAPTPSEACVLLVEKLDGVEEEDDEYYGLDLV